MGFQVLFLLWLEEQQKFDFFLYSCVVILSSHMLVNSDRCVS